MSLVHIYVIQMVDFILYDIPDLIHTAVELEHILNFQALMILYRLEQIIEHADQMMDVNKRPDLIPCTENLNLSVAQCFKYKPIDDRIVTHSSVVSEYISYPKDIHLPCIFQ